MRKKENIAMPTEIFFDPTTNLELTQAISQPSVTAHAKLTHLSRLCLLRLSPKGTTLTMFFLEGNMG